MNVYLWHIILAEPKFCFWQTQKSWAGWNSGYHLWCSFQSMEYIYHNIIVASRISLCFSHSWIYWKHVWNEHHFCPASLQGYLVSEVQICPAFKIFLRQRVPSYIEYPGFGGKGCIVSAHILSAEPRWHVSPKHPEPIKLLFTWSVDTLYTYSLPWHSSAPLRETACLQYSPIRWWTTTVFLRK